MPVRSKCQCRCASLILIEDESRSVDVKVDRATLARSQISTGTETLGERGHSGSRPSSCGFHTTTKSLRDGPVPPTPRGVSFRTTHGPGLVWRPVRAGVAPGGYVSRGLCCGWGEAEHGKLRTADVVVGLPDLGRAHFSLERRRRHQRRQLALLHLQVGVCARRVGPEGDYVVERRVAVQVGSRVVQGTLLGQQTGEEAPMVHVCTVDRDGWHDTTFHVQLLSSPSILPHWREKDRPERRGVPRCLPQGTQGRAPNIASARAPAQAGWRRRRRQAASVSGWGAPVAAALGCAISNRGRRVLGLG
eukprot:m.33333 g.33333  ORF g.33333 m.33333 type:complete len:304 (+) comp7184_c0_seq1:7171-8082(+)